MSTPTAKLFIPALFDVSNYSISASVISANPCAATYALEFPYTPYCDPSGTYTICGPTTTKTVLATEGSSSYGFAFSADAPYIVSGSPTGYAELASQVCTAVPSASEVVCKEVDTITLPGGSLSTSPVAQAQTFNSTLYGIPITANAGALSRTSGSCTGQTAQTSSAVAMTTSSSSSSSGSSSRSAAASMAASSSSSQSSTTSSRSAASSLSASNMGLKLVALLLATSLSTIWSA